MMRTGAQDSLVHHRQSLGALNLEGADLETPRQRPLISISGHTFPPTRGDQETSGQRLGLHRKSEHVLVNWWGRLWERMCVQRRARG